MIKLFLAGLPGGPVLLGLWSFLTSTIGLVLIAAVIAYTAGYKAADKKADLQRLQAEIATLKADQATSENARTLAERQASSLEAHLKSNQEKVDALTADLAKRKAARPSGTPARDCGISARDARSLSNIR
jgi:uncharacterized protein YlxW (UPF0749 family)